VKGGFKPAFCLLLELPKFEQLVKDNTGNLKPVFMITVDYLLACRIVSQFTSINLPMFEMMWCYHHQT